MTTIQKFPSLAQLHLGRGRRQVHQRVELALEPGNSKKRVILLKKNSEFKYLCCGLLFFSRHLLPKRRVNLSECCILLQQINVLQCRRNLKLTFSSAPRGTGSVCGCPPPSPSPQSSCCSGCASGSTTENNNKLS